MTKAILWLLYVQALGYWARHQRAKLYPNFLAERMDAIPELRVRVNIRSQAVKDAKAC